MHSVPTSQMRNKSSDMLYKLFKGTYNDRVGVKFRFFSLAIEYKLEIMWSWQHMHAIPALGGLKQEDHETEAMMGYRARSCL